MCKNESRNKNILIVGIGPHAKRIYYPYLNDLYKKGFIESLHIIDLESKKHDILKFIEANKYACTSHCFIKESIELPQILGSELDFEVDRYINNLLAENLLDAAIIATEPKTHKIYLKKLLESGVPVLTDKPLTAPIDVNYNPSQADQVYADLLDILKYEKAGNTRCVVQVQRRSHPAWNFVFDTAKEIVDEYGVCINFFDIYHSDGKWHMPHEYGELENHPYKYGYGKLFHSGYHFVDIAAWVCEINANIIDDAYLETESTISSPENHYKQIGGAETYKKIFGKDTAIPNNTYTDALGFGEVDIYTQLNMYSGDYIMCRGNINLLQSGFSRRSWFDLPEDTYKSNGRVRQQSLKINIGPLMSIHIHSYQSTETNKSDTMKGSDVGCTEHMEVYVFRNSDIIGGKSFERFDFGDNISKQGNKSGLFIGQNEASRFTNVDDLIFNRDTKSTLSSQIITTKILANICKSISTKNKEKFKLC